MWNKRPTRYCCTFPLLTVQSQDQGNFIFEKKHKNYYYNFLDTPADL